MALQVRDALLVVDAALGVDVVVDGAPVLGHVDGHVGVLVLDPNQHLRQALGLHGPAHGRLLPSVRYDGTRPEVGKRNALAHFDGRIADGVSEVVVDAEEVDGNGDLLQIPIPDERKIDAKFSVKREQVLRVLAAKQGIQVEPVRLPVHPAGGLPVGLSVSRRAGRMQVQSYAELVSVPGGSHPLHRQTVAQQEVVGGGEGLVAVLMSRGVDAEAVAHPGRDPGLVQGDPEPHLIG